ncbi:MAG: hypothetical protein H6681_04170 [Desulfobacteraceae bacterium]|nr:hypothetical protein [Desulfobacteraceae bacterium]MCB9494624.1 hypothetical protein [Desulfobacteraceae bacterium]
MQLRKSVFLFLLIFPFFYFGCASKNIVKNETVNVCVIPDKNRPIQMENIKTDLENEAVSKFLEKYKVFSAKDLTFKDRFYYNLKEIDKYCLKAKISADKKRHNSDDSQSDECHTTADKEKKFIFSEDFNNASAYSKYGKGLVISGSEDSKGITASSSKKTQAEFFTGKNENLELIFHIKHKLCSRDLSDAVHVDLLKINYINSREDQLKFIAEKTIKPYITCDIMLGRQKSQNMKISFKDNYNIFKIIKSKRQISIWLNNEFAGAFLASGDIVESIKFDIDNKTILKHLEIKAL